MRKYLPIIFLQVGKDAKFGKEISSYFDELMVVWFKKGERKIKGPLLMDRGTDIYGEIEIKNHLKKLYGNRR